MYAWIWHHLPFGRPGKIIGSLLLTSLVVALLWYAIFPWAEPLLPFDDVQVENGGTTGGDGGAGVEGTSGDEHDVPYDTTTNRPGPSATPSR